MCSKHTTMVFEYKKNENNKYVCSVCGAIKDKQNTMHYHMKRHEGTKAHECNQCDQSFYQKIELDNHVKIIHEKEEASIQCPFNCKCAFHTKAQCRIHLARTHLQEYTKKSCELHTSTSKNIYTCLICNKECNSHPSILYHIIGHAKTDPVYSTMLQSL